MFRGGLLGFWVATVSYKLLLLNARLLLSVTDLWEDEGFTTADWKVEGFTTAGENLKRKD